MDTTLIVVTLGSFLAAAINAALATGGVYVLLLFSMSVVPVTAAISLQTVFSAGSLSARILFFWQHINWRIVGFFMLGSVPGVAAGAWGLANVPERSLTVILGVVILILIWMPKGRAPLQSRRAFVGIGTAHSFLGTMLGIGGVLQAMILRTKLDRMAVTGTLAASMLLLDVLKTASYIGMGFNYLDFWPHIVLATLAGFAGVYVGKLLSKSMPEHVFRIAFRVLVSFAALRLVVLGLF